MAEDWLSNKPKQSNSLIAMFTLSEIQEFQVS